MIIERQQKQKGFNDETIKNKINLAAALQVHFQHFQATTRP